MYDDTAFLIGIDGTPVYDDYGNEVIMTTESKIFVQPRSVYRSEFYAAAATGLHPTITFDIASRADYHGEKAIRWNGRVYTVIRADWAAQRDRLSLICEERVGDGER